MSEQRTKEMIVALESFYEGYVQEQQDAQRLIVANEEWAKKIGPALGAYAELVSKDDIASLRVLRVLIERIWYKGYQAGKRSAGIKPLVFKEVE